MQSNLECYWIVTNRQSDKKLKPPCAFIWLYNIKTPGRLFGTLTGAPATTSLTTHLIRDFLGIAIDKALAQTSSPYMTKQSTAG